MFRHPVTTIPCTPGARDMKPPPIVHFQMVGLQNASISWLGRILSDATKDQIQYMLMFRDTCQHGYWLKWSRSAAYEKTG